MRITITTRLGALAGTAIAAVLLVAAYGTHQSSALAEASTQLSAAPAVIQQATLADMYHDATRSDVYRAVIATDTQSIADIGETVDEDIANLRGAARNGGRKRVVAVGHSGRRSGPAGRR